MKRILFTLCLFSFVISGVCAQELDKIKLNPVNKARDASFMEALSKRSSNRDIAAAPLKDQDLSDLLWAANGINRPESGRRTAPSSSNVQDIDLYVFTPKGVYLYDAKEHALNPVVAGDHRMLIADDQEYVSIAPVSVLMVSDLARFKYSVFDPAVLQMAAMDAGLVSQNINLFCAANGLATVPRVTMKLDEIRELLKLRGSQIPLMNNPVGYPQ